MEGKTTVIKNPVPLEVDEDLIHNRVLARGGLIPTSSLNPQPSVRRRISRRVKEVNDTWRNTYPLSLQLQPFHNKSILSISKTAKAAL